MKKINLFGTFVNANQNYYYNRLLKEVVFNEPANLLEMIDKKDLKDNCLFIFYPNGKNIVCKRHTVLCKVLALFIFSSFIISIIIFFFFLKEISFINGINWLIELLSTPFIFFASICFHEIGHGIFSKLIGGYNAEWGLKKNILTPFFIKSFFVSKKDLSLYFIGGIMFNLLLFSLFLIIWVFFLEPIFIYFSGVNLFLFLINFIPNKMIKSDGYKFFHNLKQVS